jgi:hypothetical protein
MFNHTKKHFSDNHGQIHLLKAKDKNGERCFFYVFIDKDKVDKFRKIPKKTKLDLLDYGKVVESGFGEPSEEIKKKMKEEYNFEQ